MTNHEKKMKAAAIAVSIYLQSEQEENITPQAPAWGKMGQKMAMTRREFTQRRGKGLWLPK